MAEALKEEFYSTYAMTPDKRKEKDAFAAKMSPFFTDHMNATTNEKFISLLRAIKNDKRFQMLSIDPYITGIYLTIINAVTEDIHSARLQRNRDNANELSPEEEEKRYAVSESANSEREENNTRFTYNINNEPKNSFSIKRGGRRSRRSVRKNRKIRKTLRRQRR
jgi:hypothetical protein